MPARILVVEANRGVRALVADVLTADGHEVTGVANGAEALVLIEQREQRPAFDLILSDLTDARPRRRTSVLGDRKALASSRVAAHLCHRGQQHGGDRPRNTARGVRPVHGEAVLAGGSAGSRRTETGIARRTPFVSPAGAPGRASRLKVITSAPLPTLMIHPYSAGAGRSRRRAFVRSGRGSLAPAPRRSPACSRTHPLRCRRP